MYLFSKILCISFSCRYNNKCTTANIIAYSSVYGLFIHSLNCQSSKTSFILSTIVVIVKVLWLLDLSFCVLVVQSIAPKALCGKWSMFSSDALLEWLKPYFGGDTQKSRAKSGPNFKKTTPEYSFDSKPTRRLDIITLIEVLCREYRALRQGLESRLNRHTHYSKTNHSVSTITTQLTCVVSENKNHERNCLGLTRKQHERQFSFHKQSQTSDPETSVTVFRTRHIYPHLPTFPSCLCFYICSYFCGRSSVFYICVFFFFNL